jgi:hypothetical protein
VDDPSFIAPLSALFHPPSLFALPCLPPEPPIEISYFASAHAAPHPLTLQPKYRMRHFAGDEKQHFGFVYLIVVCDQLSSPRRLLAILLRNSVQNAIFSPISVFAGVEGPAGFFCDIHVIEIFILTTCTVIGDPITGSRKPCITSYECSHDSHPASASNPRLGD